MLAMLHTAVPSRSMVLRFTAYRHQDSVVAPVHEHLFPLARVCLTPAEFTDV